MKTKFLLQGALPALTLFASSAMAVPSLQIGDADGGVCDSYDSFSEDCIVGGQFTITSLQPSDAYLVFVATPMTAVDTFTIAPMIGANPLALVQSGYGTPPFSDPNALAPHGIFDTYVEVYAVDFNTAGTVYNTQPGNSGDFASGFIEIVDINLTALTDGLHIDLFRCSTGAVEDGDCMITQGFDIAPYSHDATYVPIPAAVWLFGSGLLGLVGIARRKRS